MNNEAVDFFEHVLDVEGKLLLWLLPSDGGEKRSYWYDEPAELAEAADNVADSKYHVYFGMGSRTSDLGPYLRGERKDYYQYRTLWLDIDVLGANHASKALPPTLNDAKELVLRMPLKPSAVIASGGGLQAYWVLKEALDASEMEEFLPYWHATWRAIAEEREWHIDNVFDLGRVMRVPGSMNRKNDARVTIVKADWSRTYDISEFEDYLREPEQRAVPVAPRDPGLPERPGDAYNRVHAGDAFEHAKKILMEYGFQPERIKVNGELPMVRPGKSLTAGSSATIYPDGHVTVYSDDPSLPTSKVGKTGLPLDPYAVFVMFKHEGDFGSASRELRGLGFGDPGTSDDEWVLDGILASGQIPVDLPDKPPSSSWLPISLFDVEDEPEESPPEVGIRKDGVWLLYKGKVHTVFGEPGGMKSWFTQVIGKQVVEDNGDVLVVDFENSKRSIYDRYRYLGLEGDELRHIDIVTPDTPFSPAERVLICQKCAERGYDLIVVDGTTDAMVTFGLDPNSTPDAAKFDKGFLKVLAGTGAAVIYVDHVVKSTENRGSWGFGSQHKKSAIDGVSFGVEGVSSFGKGMHGRAKILIHKDKPGDLLQHALDGVHSTIAELDMISHPETHMIQASIEAPSVMNNPNFRPTGLMERICAYVKINPGLSQEAIITGSGHGSAKKDYLRLAFQLLESEGYLESFKGDAYRDQRYQWKKDYHELEDILSPSNMARETAKSVSDETWDRIKPKFGDPGEDPFPEEPVLGEIAETHSNGEQALSALGEQGTILGFERPADVEDLI